MEKITLVMAVFAVIYSGITLGLYLIATRQLDGMKKEQRPWIRISTQTSSPPGPNTPSPNPPGPATPSLGKSSPNKPGPGRPSPDTPSPALPEKTVPFIFPLHLTNVGKTPAKYIEADLFIESVKNGREPLLNKSSFLTSLTTGVFFPNVPADFLAPYTLLQSDWEDYREGRSFLVIYGRVTYKDVFQTEHWTDYCEFHALNPGTYTTRKCTDYNNTDDE
jgi:hypothetical protein